MAAGGLFEWLARRSERIPESALTSISVDRIRPSRFQPRRAIDPDQLAELTDSIREVGVLQPVVVRPLDEEDGMYELVMGERRWRAARAAGLRQVPALVRSFTDDEAALTALVENLQREDLSYWEEAFGYERMLRMFGMTQEQLANSLGKNQSTIANKLRLLKLPEEVRLRAQAASLGERHVRALLRLRDEAQQIEALSAMAERAMNAREAESYVEQLLQGVENAVDHAHAGAAGDYVGRRSALRADPERRDRKTSRAAIKDVRIMLNTFRQGVEALRKAGLDADMQASEAEDHIEIRIRIPIREEMNRSGLS